MGVPTIFYASRTHSQISQLIREYRKTSYRVPMAILASRRHYCTNDLVCAKHNLDEECKMLLKDKTLEFVGCPEFKNVNKVKAHPSLQKGGSHEVHDIEDLVRIGRTVKGCPYFASQTMAEEAQLVFCPYNYIINPIVRRAMDINIAGSILILDEAHNIEDMARDAGSIDVEEEVLDKMQTELGQLCMIRDGAAIYQPLHDMIQGIIGWIGDRKNTLQKHEFEHYLLHWTGDKAMKELQLAGITQQYFPVLKECASKAIKAVSDADSADEHLSGISAITLEGLFSSLNYFFTGNGCHMLDYQLVLQRYVKRDGSNASSGWTCSVSLWCLSPAVVFREIANLSRSVILTSGTLSPMGSFASELGVQFEACMEAPHVIDVESQLWASVISSGPRNCQLNASYKTADGYDFQDALGASLEEICRIVPGGALVFFPSYKLLEKLRSRWCQTGQWSRLNAQKTVYVEPRGSTDEFELVLRGYYDAICGKRRTIHGKPRGSQKRGVKHLNTKHSPENPVKGGAAFLAVCRGKVSEGIDFSDENARVVVIVGIPFPNINDIQVMLKKKYNDTFKSSKSLLSGNEWYCHQAFRALNQAAGRCIRHRFDYGAVIFLDERFKQQRNLTSMSKWLRNSIHQYDSFEDSMEGLQAFFVDAEKRLGLKGKDLTQNESLNSDITEGLPSSTHNIMNQAIPRKKNQKQKKLNCHAEKYTVPADRIAKEKSNHSLKVTYPLVKDDIPFCHLKAHCITKVKEEGETTEKLLTHNMEYVNLESSHLKDSRYLESSSIASSKDTLNQSFIENSEKGDFIAQSSDISIVGNSGSTFQSCDQFSDVPCVSLCIAFSNEVPEGACTSTVTPEKLLSSDLCNGEKETSLNRSVNSYSQRKRKMEDSKHTNCPQTDHLSSPCAESCCRTNNATNRNSCRDTDQRIRSLFTDNCAECKPQKLMHGIFANNNQDVLHSSSDTILDKKLRICCSFCKSPLGLRENDFLVTCSLISSCKAYLSYVLNYGPRSTGLTEYSSKTPLKDIRILLSEVSSVDLRIINKHIMEGAQQHGTWSEEDGCVYRTLSCPFCTESTTCLGLQVLATDAPNVHLLNKVLFYADHLDIENEQTPKTEILLPNRANTLRNGSGSVETEKDAYNPQPESSGSISRMKSKLRLPKRESLPSSQCQDGCHT